VSDNEPLVLVVEDEVQMRRFLRAALTSHDYRVVEASCAREAIQLATSHNPALILLDLGLPDADGIDVTRQLREWCKAPIIVISARGAEQDKVIALDAGADDYLTKPFGTNELLARMRVSLRHAAQLGGEPASSTLEIGELVVDLARHEVRVGDREVRLTPTEFRILALLARNAGKVLTHRQILTEVWGPAYGAQTHYVRVHMAELRRKVERDPARPQMLLTEAGVGYRLRDRS